MKYINKYIKFFENETLVEPEVVTKNAVDTKEVASEADVVNRFERIYKELSVAEQKEINSYFEK